MRVVSLLPSATEIVYALGREPVGVSHECDHPPAARELPAVTTSRIDADASSAEIDRQVLAAESGGGVYDIDVGTLDRLDPDLIVTQGICDVCAVDEVVVERAVGRIDAEPEILTTDPHSVGDVLADVRRIGRAVGREDRADAVVADLEARIDAVRERVRSHGPDEPPRVAVFDWLDPVMTAGHWLPKLVECAGGEYGMADPGDASRPRTWEAVREYDPEVVVAAPCGFGLEQTAANLADLTGRKGWADLSAVRDGRAWAMDGDQYVNRPGPRIVDTLECLAPIVAPGAFERPSAAVALPIAELVRRPEA